MNHQLLAHKLKIYARLTRLDRPIGTYLVLWPTLWSLWIAAEGVPDWHLLLIFIAGVVLMRAAGCAINDYADRGIDGHVRRTKNRPLVSGQIAPREAIFVFLALSLTAFLLVLFTNRLTILLSLGGVALAFCYPFMKRYTHLPQVVLGAAFAWSVPMAFAAQAGEVPPASWLIYIGVVLWTVAYDTFYAMVDREDDLKIGVKSTAILFGEQDRLITGGLQFMALLAFALAGIRFEMGGFYMTGLLVAGALFIWQQYLIRNRARDRCFQAFLNNNWAGLAIFLGVALDYVI